MTASASEIRHAARCCPDFVYTNPVFCWGVLSDEVCVVVVTDSALVAGKDTDDHQVHL